MESLLWFSNAVAEILTVAVRILQLPPTSVSPLVLLGASASASASQASHCPEHVVSKFPYLTVAR